MSDNFPNKKISLIYAMFLIFILFTCIVLEKSMYNRLVVIDDKEKVLQYRENSVPVKLTLYSKRWGNITVSDNDRLKELWNIIDSIPRSKNFYGSKVKNSFDEITGTIHYLNNKKSTLYLSNTLRINDLYYGDENSSAYINRVRNYIYNIFCTPKTLSSIVNDKNKITVVDELGNEKKCGSNDKALIRNEILKLKKITQDTQLKEAINNKKNLNYHIRIYIEKSENISNKSLEYRDDYYDIINLDVYENQYIIVKDYGSEIVNTFYMKGDLNKICQKIF